MPGTLVLSGVRLPRPYAPSVPCPIRPPSQEFQFRVIVNTTAAASSTMSRGVPYFCQAGLGAGGSGLCSGSAALAGAGVLADAMMVGPPLDLARLPQKHFQTRIT